MNEFKCKRQLNFSERENDELRAKLIAAESELAALTARLEAKEAECARLRLPPEMTMSDHPGCVFCMEAGTPVRPGEVCPKCGDRLPTKREHELRAECEALPRRTAMSDLIERLREYHPDYGDFGPTALCEEAAAALEAAERELEATRAKLDRILIVDIKLDPDTTITAGCKIRTVVTGLSADYRSKPAALPRDEPPAKEGL